MSKITCARCGTDMTAQLRHSRRLNISFCKDCSKAVLQDFDLAGAYLNKHTQLYANNIQTEFYYAGATLLTRCSTVLTTEQLDNVDRLIRKYWPDMAVPPKPKERPDFRSGYEHGSTVPLETWRDKD